MKVEMAESAGFCFGVKRAVDTVYRLSEGGENKVCTLGPIIHNEQVVADLEARGVRAADRLEDISDKKNTTLVIRSHGVAKQVIEELKRQGISYEDATCPFVKKIHETVSVHSQNGYAIVIIGSASHPEVQGILGWTEGSGHVIETPEEAEAFTLENPAQKICVVAQTTFNYKKFQELVEILSKKGYDILAVNTICNATSTRQKEAEELAGRSEAMLVIGGRHSSNSRKLYEICKNQCENTFFIQTAYDLRDIPLDSFASLGITAGASTPNNIIQEVRKACQS
ncbi:MAG: 4-hydroxy-3-methylbut-2-enyl diphosphate reductase [Lachnospiraceae bacterium]|nr:4-hydroxy-3-methylbut-2-enyl diphosphate reductase [Lachnospiraceae bacterium]